MSTGTGHTWRDVFQAAHTSGTWSWPVGEREHHWTFSFRPLQANSDCQVHSHVTTSDNNLRQTDLLVVSTNTGNNFRLSATWVSGA